jgi:prepilin-type N-terminal cleavage/methylation domain-containing protein
MSKGVEDQTLKRAFTLIELLVVIAIIAILAAILFPVFAQAKLAAKKAVSISNQKQLGLAMLMYSNDYDDMYARQDGCTLNDSEVTAFNVQAAGTNPFPWCNGAGGANGAGGYAFRDNHYDWSKWVMPYIKTTGLIYHPVIVPTSSGLANGEVDGGYALNTAITGELNTIAYNTSNASQVTLQKYGNRTSWIGGTQTSVPSPSEAWLLMEQIQQSVAPVYEYGTTSGGYNLTVYPEAVREHWDGYFHNISTTSGNKHDCYSTGVLDPTAAPFNESVPISYCDGHTKALQVGAFLAQTPTASQYLPGFYYKYGCGFFAVAYSSGAPVTNALTPFWGGSNGS